MELCTQSQWEDACEADQGGTVWSFATDADTYTPGICNDVEGGTGAAWAGGSGEDCYADSPNGAIFDMSGNVSEWTQTEVNSGGNNYFRVRGGNYTAYGPATACNFSFVLGVPTFANADLGFRCCGTNPPNVP
jgi:formylglycine-generating enzyme required for sulfatase activity